MVASAQSRYPRAFSSLIVPAPMNRTLSIEKPRPSPPLGVQTILDHLHHLEHEPAGRPEDRQAPRSEPAARVHRFDQHLTAQSLDPFELGVDVIDLIDRMSQAGADLPVDPPLEQDR